MTLNSYLNLINQARFHELPTSSPLFDDLGIPHGFTGKQMTPPSHMYHAKQVHGTVVVEASDQTAPVTAVRSDADGVFSTNSHLTVAVKTADCLPVLIYGHGFIAAIHAGWRGLTQGILSEALLAAKRKGLSPNDLSVAIGPAIAGANYEVGDEVVAAIQSDRLGLNKEEAALVLSRGKQWHVDIKLAAHLSLLKQGIPANHISVSLVNTFTDSRFYSFRRDGKLDGTNWSWLSFPQR